MNLIATRRTYMGIYNSIGQVVEKLCHTWGKSSCVLVIRTILLKIKRFVVILLKLERFQHFRSRICVENFDSLLVCGELWLFLIENVQNRSVARFWTFSIKNSHHSPRTNILFCRSSRLNDRCRSAN